MLTIHSKKYTRYNCKVDRNIQNERFQNISIFSLKKSFAKIKTELKAKILNLIKQWQQLETNPSYVHDHCHFLK